MCEPRPFRCSEQMRMFTLRGEADLQQSVFDVNLSDEIKNVNITDFLGQFSYFRGEKSRQMSQKYVKDPSESDMSPLLPQNGKAIFFPSPI